MSQYIHDEGSFEGVGGQKIYFQFFKPKGYKNVVIFVHSMGEHSGRYLFPIEYFIDRKIAFYGLDHRGHGRSGGKRGHIESFSDYLDDLSTFDNIVRKREGDKRFFLLGHGLGGLIAVRYIEEHPGSFSGAMITSSALKLKHVISPFMAYVGDKLSRHLPRFSMTNEIDPVNLTHDKDVVKKYMEDDLVHNKVTARFFIECSSAMKVAFEKAETVTLPFLIMHAGADEVVSPEGSGEFYEKIASTDKTLFIYKGMYHEILNEIDRAAVYKEMEKWLAPRLLK
jgi:alpha-beta hydrolase superfamily lysophospholipase